MTYHIQISLELLLCTALHVLLFIECYRQTSMPKAAIRNFHFEEIQEWRDSQFTKKGLNLKASTFCFK